jgi:SAM-dependent methyltransferase
MHQMAPTGTWPKRVPVLTPEQEAIREDFMQHWHRVLPKQFGLLERFNHTFPAARREDWAGRIRTLEIGAGFGAHLAFEDLSFQDYTVLELRESMAKHINSTYPQVEVLIGDVQQSIPVPDGFFDRVVAVHVLEHLPDLPAAFAEIRRVMSPGGLFSIVLPCEGGLMYDLARRVSSRRIFERRYHTSYDWFISAEHVNTYGEIIQELKRVFAMQEIRFWPFRVPAPHLNLVVGVACRPDSDSADRRTAGNHAG